MKLVLGYRQFEYKWFVYKPIILIDNERSILKAVCITALKEESEPTSYATDAHELFPRIRLCPLSAKAAWLKAYL